MSEAKTNALIQPITLADNEVRFYKNEGYLYLPGLIEREQALKIAQEVVKIVTGAMNVPQEQLSHAKAQDDRLRQTTQYLAGGGVDAMVNSPALCAIAAQLMEGPSSVYMPFTAVKSGGGGGKFHFHQDNQYTRYTDGMKGINIWFALCDMTPENGCLQVVPRSHLRGTLSRQSGDASTGPVKSDHADFLDAPQDFLPVRMRAGDAIAFSRITVHGSGPNNTFAPRLGYAVQFFRNDAMASWDNQPPRPLISAHRYNTGPVERIGPIEAKSLDGH